MSRVLANDSESVDSLATNSTTVEQILRTKLISDVAEIVERASIPRERTEQIKAAGRDFPALIPESAFDRVERGRIDDPVLAQFLPDPRELIAAPGYSADPLREWSESDDESPNTSPILQKYAGRALVLTTFQCAGHCRFCFRRFFPRGRSLFPVPRQYRASQDSSTAIKEYFDRAFAPIRGREDVTELILSGGDPLVVSNEDLKSLLNYIASLGNVKRVRFHSRVPVLAPKRIDADFPSFGDYSTEKGVPLVLHLSIHVNSSREINDDAANAILALRRKGYVLTSQTVLLKGINDNVDALRELYERLADLGVVPYYLFQLDRVQGSAHWATPTERGRELIRELETSLPGYAVPKFAREIPGQPKKTNLMSERDVD